MSKDAQRDLDSEGMRQVRELDLNARKRAARRVVESGGCVAEAAAASRTSAKTVKRWAAEGRWSRE